MAWFRTDDQMMFDTKIQGMDPIEFKVWMFLLCLANQARQHGVFIIPNLKIFKAIGVTPRRVIKAFAYFTLWNMASWESDRHTQAIRITVIHFAERQYLRPETGESTNGHNQPLTAAERQAAKRERERFAAQNVTRNGAEDVTPGVTFRDSDVTSGVTESRNVTSESRAHVKAEAEGRIHTKGLAKAEARLNPLTPQPSEVSAQPAQPFAHKAQDTASAAPAAQAQPPPLPSLAEPLPIQNPSAERSGLLTNHNVSELLKNGPPGGPNWSLAEIDIGEKILMERPALPHNPAGLLHKSLLAEVRAGKRPKAQERLNIPVVVRGGQTEAEAAQARDYRLAEAAAATQRALTRQAQAAGGT